MAQKGVKMQYIKDTEGNYYRLVREVVQVSNYDRKEWQKITVLQEASQSEAREIELSKKVLNN